MNTRLIPAMVLVVLYPCAQHALAQSGEYWKGPNGIDFAVVRAPGNEADEPDEYLRRFGRVDYSYSISAFEVTNTQYAAFLNSVSAEGDPHGLWHHNEHGPDEIQQFDNGRGGYRYEVLRGKERNPVVRVTHRNIFRMMNWMHNGMQDDMSTTDYGAYDSSQWGYVDGRYTDSMQHEPDAKYWLSSEDEWYKAAYFDPDRYGPGTPGYWKYPTRHEEEPDPWWRQGADPDNSAIYLTPDSQPVGTIPTTFSPWGVFDMAGSAKEYIADWYTDGGFLYGEAIVTRGANWQGTGSEDRRGSRGLAFAFRNGRAEWDHHSFRMVTRSIPAPSAGCALLALAMVLNPRKRRRVR